MHGGKRQRTHPRQPSHANRHTDVSRRHHQGEPSEPARSEAPQSARYLGVADWWGRHIWVEQNGVRRPLRYCGEDRAVSYTWGRTGLGARELARALLLDATSSTILAERFCRDLTHEVVARLLEPEFALERDKILAWLTDRH